MDPVSTLPGSPPRVLLIDDDMAGRELGVFNLRMAGYAVDDAANGEQGLSLFFENSHDVVVTDVKMPGICGLQVLRSIKEKAPHTPVVLITAYAGAQVEEAARESGAFEILSKPCTARELIDTISSALKASVPIES